MIDSELAAEIAQQHEAFLTQLEGLAIQAIATNNWDAFYSHLIDFQNEYDLHGETGIAVGDDVSADEMDTPSADVLPQTSKGDCFNHAT